MNGPINWLAVLAIRGPDAVVFSHSQLASNVKTLPNGHWQWTALLQIQGRVLALAVLLRSADDEVFLLLPRDLRETVRTTLKRYVLRSKVRIEDDDALRAFGLITTTALLDHETVAQSGAYRIDGEALVIDLAGRARRRLAIVPAVQTTGTPIDMFWRGADIADRIPWVRAGTSGEFIPQALELSRLAAYSVSKGCYPGQEIVARTHFLGRNRRVLRTFHMPVTAAVPAPGDRLHGAADAVGDPVAIVIDALPNDGRIVGLAVARDRETRSAWWPGGSDSIPVAFEDSAVD